MVKKSEDVQEATRKTANSSLPQEELDRINALDFEHARDELTTAVRTLEAGGLTLEESMHQWEIGEALASRAQQLLNDIRERFDAARSRQRLNSDTAGTQSNLERD